MHASPSPYSATAAAAAVDVVVRRDDRVRGDRRRHAQRGRDPERRQSGAGFGEQRVDVAVVAAGELEDTVAAGEAARQPDRAHRRLRAGRDETNALDGRNRVDDLRGELDLALGRRAEGRAVARRGDDRIHGLGIRVPEEQRPPGHHPVDVRASVGGLEPRARRPPHEQRLVQPDGAHRADGRVDAAGDQLLRPAPELAPRLHVRHAAKSIRVRRRSAGACRRSRAAGVGSTEPAESEGVGFAGALAGRSPGGSRSARRDGRRERRGLAGETWFPPRQSQPASSLVQYEITRSAPARLIAVRLSIAAARSSR